MNSIQVICFNLLATVLWLYWLSIFFL